MIIGHFKMAKPLILLDCPILVSLLTKSRLWSVPLLHLLQLLRFGGVEVAMAKRAPTSGKPKNGRRRASAPSIWFVVAVESWQWGFSFGVEKRSERDDPYSDYRHLHVRGNVVKPTNTRAKYANVVFVPSQSLNQSDRADRIPLSVGHLHSYRGVLDVDLSMPADVLPSLLAVFAADRVRHLVFEGTGTRADANIVGYSVETSLTEEDLAELC